ncbi:FadR/GntR family transcriptional regulator [Actinobaculum suis]|uniref:FadR/GntR family transcriptional regulator n=1 Tax=Actinobaculum suis TaxID=1657 RepID=UPI0009E50042|nr:GntR family transcriptional regulator [Actinobaculum suis]
MAKKRVTTETESNAPREENGAENSKYEGTQDSELALLAVEAVTGPRKKASHRADIVMNSIKSYIVQHKLSSGDPLPTEAQLCEELGVSRSSVREALSKLEALDVVSSRQGRGTVVGQMSFTPLVETLLLRATIEEGPDAEAIQKIVDMRRYLDLGMSTDIVAALRGTKDQDLRQIVENMKEKALRGERFWEEDIRFHIGLTESLDNGVASQMVTALWVVHCISMQDIGTEGNPQMLETARAHERILDAAEAGDIFAYRGAINDHYRPLESIIEAHTLRHYA